MDCLDDMHGSSWCQDDVLLGTPICFQINDIVHCFSPTVWCLVVVVAVEACDWFVCLFVCKCGQLVVNPEKINHSDDCLPYVLSCFSILLKFLVECLQSSPVLCGGKSFFMGFGQNRSLRDGREWYMFTWALGPGAVGGGGSKDIRRCRVQEEKWKMWAGGSVWCK